MENALNLDTVNLRKIKRDRESWDQTLLPNQCKYLNISTAGDIWEAIYSTESKRSTGDWRYRRICLTMYLQNQIETEDKDGFVKECTKMMVVHQLLQTYSS